MRTAAQAAVWTLIVLSNVPPGGLLALGAAPKSNGMAEAFVKTFKRDCVRVNPIPDATTALEQIDLWMED